MSTDIVKTDSNNQLRSQEYVRPHYEVDGDEHAYEVRVFLPGVPRNQSTVTLERDSLTVEASRQPHTKDGWRSIHREIPTADYRLQLQLNVRINEDKISAETKDGVISIRLPVAEEAKPRTIKIK